MRFTSFHFMLSDTLRLIQNLNGPLRCNYIFPFQFFFGFRQMSVEAYMKLIICEGNYLIIRCVRWCWCKITVNCGSIVYWLSTKKNKKYKKLTLLCTDVCLLSLIDEEIPRLKTGWGRKIFSGLNWEMHLIYVLWLGEFGYSLSILAYIRRV